MNPEEPKSEQNKRLYLRMFLFALVGFVLFFSGTSLRLVQLGAFNTSNPYGGPPPLLTCLLVGGFGLVVGAIAGLLKKKR